MRTILLHRCIPVAAVLFLPLTVATNAGAQESLVFGARSGMVLNRVHPDRAADFEAALADLSRAFQDAENPVRSQQAAGWRFFKVAEPGPGDTVLFVFVVNPVLRGADYSLKAIFEEAFPEQEAGRAYRRFADSLAAPQTVFNLELIAVLKPPEKAKPAPRKK